MESLEVEDSVPGGSLVHVEVDVFAAGVDGPLDDSGIHEDFVALGIDEVSLLVENIVILEKMLSYIEVALFDALLGAFNDTADHGMLKWLAAVHSKASHHGLQTVLCKEAEQGVVEAYIEAGCSRVSLSSGTSSELVVYTSGFVTFGSKDVETSESFNFLVVGFPLVISLFFGNL